VTGFPERALSVLVVEDEALVRLLIHDELVDAGFIVRLAGSAEEAIEILQGPELVDFVFSDVIMPGSMGGIGLADWIRHHKPGLPVALTSGVARAILTTQGMRDDQAFFAKPVHFNQLIAHIDTIGVEEPVAADAAR
jgi:DNA-binding NtrC family response regulator